MRKAWNKIKEFVSLILEVIKEAWFNIKYTIEKNLYALGKVLELSTPYIMWYLVIQLYKERGYFAIGGELFIPVLLFFVCGIIKKASNKKGKGYDVPVYSKRFTKEDGYEVTISEDDLQEVILYLNDVENYIEKRGLKKWES